MPGSKRKRQCSRVASYEDEGTSAADGANTSPAASRASSPAPIQSVSTSTKRGGFEQRFKVHIKSDEAVLGELSSERLTSYQNNNVPPDAQKATWVSSAYGHFLPPKISRSGDVVRYIFHCKECVRFTYRWTIFS